MNIKELAEQAGMTNTLGCFWQSGDYQLEQFADLIRTDEARACAKHYLGIMRDAVEQAAVKEREACALVCDEREQPNLYGAKECANEIRQRGDKTEDGIALTSIHHPEGDPVTDDHEFNPESLETIEADMPVMPEEQLETWMHNMIRACNRPPNDSDINVIKLIQHIENLYMQGRSDEREACALVCDEKALYFQYDFIPPYDVADYCAEAIRQRGDTHGND